MSKKYDVVYAEKYTDRDGAEKTRYTNIGAVIEGQHGLSMKLQTIPVGWNGWAQFYEPKDRQQTSAPRRQSAPAPQDDGSDIPF